MERNVHSVGPSANNDMAFAQNVVKSVILSLINTIFWYEQSLNSLQPKRRLLYLKPQFVPRSKHFKSQL